MVLLLAKEKLIAASVAWCHSRGVLSAGACLKHTQCGMNRDRGADFLPQRVALFCQTLWKTCFSLENLFFPALQGFQSLLAGKYRVRDS